MTSSPNDPRKKHRWLIVPNVKIPLLFFFSSKLLTKLNELTWVCVNGFAVVTRCSFSPATIIHFRLWANDKIVREDYKEKRFPSDELSISRSKHKLTTELTHSLESLCVFPIATTWKRRKIQGNWRKFCEVEIFGWEFLRVLKRNFWLKTIFEETFENLKIEKKKFKETFENFQTWHKFFINFL